MITLRKQFKWNRSELTHKDTERGRYWERQNKLRRWNVKTIEKTKNNFLFSSISSSFRKVKSENLLVSVIFWWIHFQFVCFYSHSLSLSLFKGLNLIFSFFNFACVVLDESLMDATINFSICHKKICTITRYKKEEEEYEKGEEEENLHHWRNNGRFLLHAWHRLNCLSIFPFRHFHTFPVTLERQRHQPQSRWWWMSKRKEKRVDKKKSC